MSLSATASAMAGGFLNCALPMVLRLASIFLVTARRSLLRFFWTVVRWAAASLFWMAVTSLPSFFCTLRLMSPAAALPTPTAALVSRQSTRAKRVRPAWLHTLPEHVSSLQSSPSVHSASVVQRVQFAIGSWEQVSDLHASVVHGLSSLHPVSLKQVCRQIGPPLPSSLHWSSVLTSPSLQFWGGT